ncbi:MAG: hypothetical protein JNL67_10725 [Planctomycetaceae bacterium]|nr:hypothetical protein [Planctomycetaceae bacterium]
MDYLFFLLTLLHVLAGMLFVGLPVIACADVIRNRGLAWEFWNLALRQALQAGLVALGFGLLLAGFRWDESFERAWEIVASRWIYGFIEFAFSAGLLSLVVTLWPVWPESRWQKVLAVVTLVIAATNAWYHFPALMVVSREIRLHPNLVEGLEGAVVRQLLFSPAILWRWVHIAIGCLMFGAVWARFLIGIECSADEKAGHGGTGQTKWFAVERTLRQLVWLSLLGLWVSGLGLAFQFTSNQVTQVLALGSGSSNNLMLGIVAANVAALRSLYAESRPDGLSRFFEVGLMIVALAAMLGR